MTKYLIGLGHKRIGFIKGPPDHGDANARFEGYRAALDQAGLPFSRDTVLTASIDRQDGFNREAGYASMKELAKRSSMRNPVTAVFVSSDVQAIGALEAARELGIRVPEDIAMVSFDDIELARHAQLSTMRQPMHEMGSLAVEKLQARIKDPLKSPTLTTFLPELIIRQTCGARIATPSPVRPQANIEFENSST